MFTCHHQRQRWQFWFPIFCARSEDPSHPFFCPRDALPFSIVHSQNLCNILDVERAANVCTLRHIERNMFALSLLHFRPRTCQCAMKEDKNCKTEAVWRRQGCSERACTHTETLEHSTLKHRRIYTQTLSHTDVFTHRHFHTQTFLHTDPFTHNTHLHTEVFTHKRIYTSTFLHTDAFIHRLFYTQTLWHAHTFTHRPFSA